MSVEATFKRAIEFHEAGQLTRAEKFYRKAYKAQPDNGEIQFRLAGLLCQQGSYDEAAALFSDLIAVNPGNAVLFFNLGQALNGLGYNEKALNAFSEAARLKPDFTFAHVNRIALLKRKNQFDVALQACNSALQYDQKSAELFCHLGDIQREKNNQNAAVQAFQSALKIDAMNVAAHNGLGLLFRDSGQFDAAIKQFQQGLKIVPNSALLKNGLASALLAQGNVDAALEDYRQALRDHPDDCELANNLGCALLENGCYAEAQEQFEFVLDKLPNHYQANINLLNVLSEQGNLSAAQARCRHILDFKPDAAYVSHVLANIKTFTDVDGDVRHMEQELASSEISNEQSMFLNFALGKVREDLKDYDQAMSHYAEGNALKRATVSYSVERDQRVFSEIKNTFSAEFFSQRRDYGVSSIAPIFILGMPRSGTSLAEQILSSHSDVLGAGERKDLDMVIRRSMSSSKQDAWLDEISCLGSEKISDIASQYLQRIASRFKFTGHFTDKMPGNFMYIGMIRLLFPNAKIIHCVRDPVDTCFSSYKRYFSGDGLYFTYNQKELGQYYGYYRELMDYWHQLFPDEIHELSYENLISDQEAETRKLLEFCDLSWDDKCLTFYEASRIVSTHSITQVRKPLYRSSVKLWQRYASYLQPLLEALQQGGVITIDTTSDKESHGEA